MPHNNQQKKAIKMTNYDGVKNKAVYETDWIKDKRCST